MSWQDELDQLLSKLGVQQEYTQPEQISSAQEAEFFFTQMSHAHPGVFYLMDLADITPELRVFLPTDDGPLKVHVYLVRLATSSFLNNLFALYMTSQGGSSAFQTIEETTSFHLFQTMIETMKRLFWQGDLQRMSFPPEIDVQRLLTPER